MAEHPLRERLRGLLMQALYRSGQRADALAAFRETHDYLYAELGVGPSAELQQLHRRLLDGDPELNAPTPAAPVAPAQRTMPAHRPPTPAQLPHGMADFTGRQRQLTRLDELLGREDATPIAMIIGTAGVGKTSLAVHWAHRVSDRFPDGQLYVNLRGFDAHGSAVEPGDALRGFFDAFAVPNAQVPARLEDQAALYRSLLAGRRILVVLDNARDSEQIGPLLPGAPGCAVVVTSRRRLAGVAAAGADVLSLDLLAPGEAREFFSRRVGAARVAAEPVAFDAIVAACARLPLALAIVAARAAVYPEQSLTALATDLREAVSGLDAFVGENPANDARAVLSWSYRGLGPAAARLFRLLGLHRRPDIATAAAASLAGVTVSEARRLLRELTSAHLVEEATPGRFGFHDLLRAYAKEQTLEIDSAAERRAAVLRLLDHYLHTAWLADRTLYPYREPIHVEPADPATVVPRLDGTAEALVWFMGEHATLLAAVEQAEAEDFPLHASSAGLDHHAVPELPGQVARLGDRAPNRAGGEPTGRRRPRPGAHPPAAQPGLPAAGPADRRGRAGQAGARPVERARRPGGAGPPAPRLQPGAGTPGRLRGLASNGPSWRSSCSGRPASRAARRTRSTGSAGSTAGPATTSRPSTTATSPSTCIAGSVTRRARPTHGTRWASPTITSATATPRWPATRRRSGCGASSATGTRSPPPPCAWATPSTPPATSRRPASSG
nr:hypothetical protein GCM10020092_076510 [Actinoplanes digitatis]